jgi:polyphenol oxidase
MSPDFAFVPDWPALPAHIAALSTLRSGGVSLAPYDDSFGGGGFNLGAHVGDQIEAVMQNRTMLDRVLPSAPKWLSQIHGTDVLDLGQLHADLVGDASFTTLPRVVCAVQTADCLPVLFCDGKTNVVGAAHAGWRGLVSGVLENTVSKMLAAGAKINDMSAWLGPAIGPQAFEVGAEVRAQFVAADRCALAAFQASASNPDKFYADIYALARLRLRRAGIQNIFGGEFCTVSQEEKFYSYRRDGVTGRMASLIWIK